MRPFRHGDSLLYFHIHIVNLDDFVNEFSFSEDRL
jgi:hypothetical protein